MLYCADVYFLIKVNLHVFNPFANHNSWEKIVLLVKFIDIHLGSLGR